MTFARTLKSLSPLALAAAFVLMPGLDTHADVIDIEKSAQSLAKSRLYDNSGLSFNLDEGDDVPDPLPTHSTYVISGPLTEAAINGTDSDGDTKTHWYTASNSPTKDIYNFGDDRVISGIILHNFNVEGTDGTDYSTSGVQGFTIQYRSQDDVANNGNRLLRSFGSFVAAQADEDGDTPGQRFDFNDGGLRISQIQFSFDSNYGGEGFGLGEIRFVEVVPEPGSMALLTAGAGLMVLRRRPSA